ncbi:aminodeoxychorismate/anthranilate synthase component II [Rhodonellum sp.]|uniref:anthranilate synthase component II n=1 Tax=Rhodonellum sp. TaxID=2231180 RepID=UPI00271EACC0|nr:aminodeoxychorismate/anthranilate synthase component II [Rhodonellum sp.]MDO9552429.1 aminodeoxychorismate/anthranilate synthase component II [Rhodonellum sp.]
MLLLIDNYDSFSHILADYFLQMGVELKIIRNDVPISELIDQSYEGLILSPGPETPTKAGNLMQILEHFHSKIPVLGVCLGHQAIGEFFGASLVKSSEPVHGKVHSVNIVTQNVLLKNLPERFDVTRYHSLELKDLPDTLEILLETDSGAVMAISHRTLPIFGIQFHPEAYLTQFGREIIGNWLAVVKNRIYFEV